MITFKRATLRPDGLDSQRIWQWRNDPLTRQMSITTEVIPWERHRAWYAQAARDPQKILLIALMRVNPRERIAPAGMVRFDLRPENPSGEEAEISINMNPALRGKGLGKPLLAGACAWGFEVRKLVLIHARIKPDNLRSIRIFEGVGFVSCGDRDDYRVYQLAPEQLKPMRSLDSARGGTVTSHA